MPCAEWYTNVTGGVRAPHARAAGDAREVLRPGSAAQRRREQPAEEALRGSRRRQLPAHAHEGEGAGTTAALPSE
eukprot:833197-Prorocentrum_minimum.AAC.2